MAEYAYSEQNRKENEISSIPNFHYFVTDVNFAGKHIPIKLQVRDLVQDTGEMETRYYTHTLMQGAKIEGIKSPVETVINDSTIDSPAATPSMDNIPQGNGDVKRAQGASYKENMPENIEFPYIPRIELSLEDVKKANGGIVPQKGNYLRETFYKRAEKRLRLDVNKAFYIPVSNVQRNSDEYVLKISRESLRKMFSPNKDAGGVLPVESLPVIDNIERIASNGVWFKSNADKKSD